MAHDDLAALWPPHRRAPTYPGPGHRTWPCCRPSPPVGRQDDEWNVLNQRPARLRRGFCEGRPQPVDTHILAMRGNDGNQPHSCRTKQGRSPPRTPANARSQPPEAWGSRVRAAARAVRAARAPSSAAPGSSCRAKTRCRGRKTSASSAAPRARARAGRCGGGGKGVGCASGGAGFGSVEASGWLAAPCQHAVFATAALLTRLWWELTGSMPPHKCSQHLINIQRDPPETQTCTHAPPPPKTLQAPPLTEPRCPP